VDVAITYGYIHVSLRHHLCKIGWNNCATWHKKALAVQRAELFVGALAVSPK